MNCCQSMNCFPIYSSTHKNDISPLRLNLQIWVCPVSWQSADASCLKWFSMTVDGSDAGGLTLHKVPIHRVK